MSSIPNPTKRLAFKQLELQDATWFAELNQDAEVLKYTGDQPFENLEAAQSFLGGYQEYQNHGFGRWAVVLRSTGEPIGWCGLKRNEEDEVDIGFRFFRKHWNCGYATEAAKACLDWGLNEKRLAYIVGRSMKENEASIRVLEKIGMSFWKENEVPGLHTAVYYRINGPKSLD
ncbi:GNAT family N-acetyltransferase [bacterium SCSIO 12741]|nr:GNAT family N-acetyltransferase [bacterium SCSIO 12741]